MQGCSDQRGEGAGGAKASSGRHGPIRAPPLSAHAAAKVAVTTSPTLCRPCTLTSHIAIISEWSRTHNIRTRDGPHEGYTCSVRLAKVLHVNIRWLQNGCTNVSDLREGPNKVTVGQGSCLLRWMQDTGSESWIQCLAPHVCRSFIVQHWTSERPTHTMHCGPLAVSTANEQ